MDSPLPSTPRPFIPLRWGFVFLSCPVKLTDEQRTGLVRVAVDAYLEDQPVVAFDWPWCRGEVRVGSDAVAVGSFVGQRFTAQIHLPEGSSKVEFLVTEAQLQARRAEVAEA